MINSISVDDAKSAATIEFIVENFSQVEEPILSPSCTIRHLPWKILFKPICETTSDQYLPKSFGFFLQCDGTESGNSLWSCSTTAQLVVVSQKAGVGNFSRTIHHSFKSKECERGFSNFMTYRELFDPKREFIKNDVVIFRAHVLADVPEHFQKCIKLKVLNNHQKMDNVEALVRILYLISPYRKTIYKIHLEVCKKNTLAIQKVFYNLHRNESICPDKLMKDLKGYDDKGSYKSSDVGSNLYHFVFAVEECMKRTTLKDAIPKIFAGKMRAVITLKGFKDKFYSERLFSFYEFRLNPEEKNIMEAFDNHLPHDIRYCVISPKPEQVELGVVYETFPPVLIVMLKRPTETDFETNTYPTFVSLLNVRFEFYEKIDLTPYSRNPESDPSAGYTLFAIMAHSHHGEHEYELFIDRYGTGEWSVYVDGCLTSCSTLEAIERNYGQDLQGYTRAASMLVYIRDSEMKDVLQEVADDDISAELIKKLEEERAAESTSADDKLKEKPASTSKPKVQPLRSLNLLEN